MFSYYLRLAWLSLKQTPVLSALMVLAMAVGIGVAGTTLTVYHSMNHNPYAHKNNQLYAVQLKTAPADNRAPTADGLNVQLTYQDAVNLLELPGSHRRSAMIRANMTIQPEQQELLPFTAGGRAADSDFFAMFEARFQYGNAWRASVDTLAEPVVVISDSLNHKLFGGANSVGRTINANGFQYTVVGVLSPFNPQPLVYDLNNGAFRDVEEMFFPFSLLPVQEVQSWGNTDGWKSEAINSYQDMLNSEKMWVQFWAEFRTPQKKQLFEQALQGYIDQQQALGRLPDPDAPYSLRTVQQWLSYNQVVGNDNRVLVGLSFLFLLVCLVNMVGLLLAKFLRRAPQIGVRRALGASQRQIFVQHLVEVALIGVIGGVVGALLSQLGLAGLRSVYANYDTLASMDLSVFLMLLALSGAAAVLAGLLPAWRICRTAPSYHLKTQ
ncbi:ABC transporter permease [Ferrimonas kyonanensis]|uniref:ABC transporter permease n=1 Tax=Ferrimonas kyonanensis TaxID=364763 RepID=UPI00041F1472|nr:ABC transporter permease [Ferrimonas kyonanensis]